MTFRPFQWIVCLVFLLFMGILAGVVLVAYSRPGHGIGLNMIQMQQLRWSHTTDAAAD